MRTTVDIPEKLMKGLHSFFPKRTKKSLIIEGLERLSMEKAYEGLRKAGGKFPDLKIDLNKLRDRDHYKKFL